MQKQTTDEEKTLYSFKLLFEAYSKFGNAHSTGRTISLTQSDKWMKTAGLIDGKILSLTDTTINFKNFKQKTLNLKQYKQFVIALCHNKKLNVEYVGTKMREAGWPNRSGREISKPSSLPNLDKKPKK